MEVAGPWVPPACTERGPSQASPSADSFKDDIQAIGRAVERLREGFAGGHSSSPKPTPGHASTQWSGALSSSTLGSGRGSPHGDRDQEHLGLHRSSHSIGDLPERSGNGSFAEEMAAEDPAFDRTNTSHGHLSLRELRSAHEASKFYSDERVRARGDDSVRISREEEELESTTTSTNSWRRRRHTHANEVGPDRSGSSGGRGNKVVADALGDQEGKQRGEEEARRRITRGAPSQFSSKGLPAAVRAVGPPPTPLRSPSPSASKDVGKGSGRKWRRRSSEEVSGDSLSTSGRSGSGRKRLMVDGSREKGGREGRERGGRGGAPGGEGAREDKGAGGSGSLLELRDALKSREKELLRLKRDVAVVATSAGGFKHLASSLGRGAKVGSSAGSSRSGNDHTKGSVAPELLYPGSGDFPAGQVERRASLVSDVDGAPGELQVAALRSSYDEEIDVLSRQSVKSSTKTAIHRLAQPQRGSESRQERRRSTPGLTSLQQQQPAPHGAAPEGTGGSSLVESAHEGLRQMRAVLKKRTTEAGRAKDDAGKMADSLKDLTMRLQRSDRKREAQAAELTRAREDAREARSELSRLARRAKEKAVIDESGERAAALSSVLALRERDEEISRLREGLEAAAGELSEEQGGTATLRARLESSERELRQARDEARVAEEESAAQGARTASAEAAARELGAALEGRIAELEKTIEENSAEAERAQGEARSAVAGLQAAEENGRRQAQEMARAREKLGVERDRSARMHLELEAAIRERTQAVEKLAIAEAEAGQLHVDLAAALATAEEKRTALLEQEKAATGSQRAAMEAELVKLRASLVVAREGREAERSRSERESARVAALREKLGESEARRKVQEEEISLVRKQVSWLDAKIEEDMSRQHTKTDAAAKARFTEAEREAAMLRGKIGEMEARLRAALEREGQATETANGLRAELLVSRDGTQRAETALATALERALAAESTADSRAREGERAAEIAWQDKETLRRGLAAAQSQVADLRAERSRVVTELEAASSSHPKAVEAVGGATPAGFVHEDLFQTDTPDVESRLALALAEAADAHSTVRRLKSKVRAYEREHNSPSATSVGAEAPSSRMRSKRRGATQAKQVEELGESNSSPGGLGGAEMRAAALREACGVMERVATALSAAVGRTTGQRAQGSRSELNDLRWDTRVRRGRVTTEGHALAEPTSGRRRRRRRAFSVDSTGVGDRGRTDDESLPCAWERGSEGGGGLSISRAVVRELSERLRLEAIRFLGVREDEREAAGERVARLKEELRDSKGREAETAARLEESRELSREQTGFVEGVWQERRRLEAELGDRHEEIERLRASEDEARAAANALESRVSDMSAALRQGQTHAKREAEAAAAAEARLAMEALRQQLDELRREVDRTKQDQAARQSGAQASGVESTPGVKHSDAVSGVGAERGQGVLGVGGVGATSATFSSSAVLEGEFQRLRAKYEKAKGRIAALEELVAASRRVSAQARIEFQGALEALKLSQELLLKIHRQRQRRNGNTGFSVAPPGMQATEAQSHAGAAPHSREKSPPPPPPPPSPPPPQEAGTTAEEVEDKGGQPAAASSSANAQVHELTTQASRLRGMSGDVKRLLQLAADEMQGALEETRESFWVATADGGRARGVAPASGGVAAVTVTSTASTQTAKVMADGNQGIDLLVEELRGVKAVARALEAEKLRLDDALGKCADELAKVQESLRDKTAQALVLEAQVTRLEADCQEARKSEETAAVRLAEVESAEEMAAGSLEAAKGELLEARNRLDIALAAQGELRGRCEELALASGAFAAEVAKQKQERAKSQERSRRAAAASAAERREECAQFSRAAEASAADRSRLEKEIVSARAEAREIDSDVAQVLDALASSEKERRRLESELDRQSRVMGDARRATEVAKGSAVHLQKDVDRERAELCEKAGQLEGIVQAGASRLKESLELETKRREQLERECKELASRAMDLEAALISASAEVRKAAKLAAERGAKHERDAAALSDETAKLRATLREETEDARVALERTAEEERRRWAKEKITMEEEASRRREAAVAEATERAHREGVAEERRRAADSRDLDQRNAAVLRKDIADMTKVLQAETNRAREALAREVSLRAQVAREATALKRKVAELEIALEKTTAAARVAGESARETVDPMSHLQAEMRSVIDSLQPDNAGKGRNVDEAEMGGGVSPWLASEQEGIGSLFLRQPSASVPPTALREETYGRDGAEAAAGNSDFAAKDESDDSPNERVHPRVLRPNVDRRGGDPLDGSPEATSKGREKVRLTRAGAVVGQRSFIIGKRDQPEREATMNDGSLIPSKEQAISRSISERTKSVRPPLELDDGSVLPLPLRSESIGDGMIAPHASTDIYLPQSVGPKSIHTSSGVVGGEGVARPQSRQADGPIHDASFAKHLQGSPPSDAGWVVRADGSKEEVRENSRSFSGNREADRFLFAASSEMGCSDDGDDASYSMTQSQVSSTTRSLYNSPMAVTAPATSRTGGVVREVLARSGSVVVRDWKAGQQEAFSQLDKKVSSSGGGGGSSGPRVPGKL